MKNVRAAILTLVMLLAMLAGERARALMALGAFERQAACCACGDEGLCCGSGGKHDDSGEPEDRDDESCPCSPRPARPLSGAPSVAAVVAAGGAVVRERASDEAEVDAPASAVAVVATFVGPGRDGEALSVGERLAWWCVRQV